MPAQAVAILFHHCASEIKGKAFLQAQVFDDPPAVTMEAMPPS
jgi:hypothetical protein